MVRWNVHGERTIYTSPWVSLALTTVEPPGSEPFEHHVIRAPGPAAGCVMVRGDTDRQEVLLLYRHRFITDTWGWEIPAGGVDAGEAPADAARREAVEETGWRPAGSLRLVTVFHPSNGLSDQTFHIFSAHGAEHVGEPTDRTEASRIEWTPTAKALELMRTGAVTDGLSLTALSMAHTIGVLTAP
jgi:8-oxo-dGTP pyrophosphatase MutT (NUDIX family)